jgi:hypothetical protein
MKNDQSFLVDAGQCCSTSESEDTFKLMIPTSRLSAALALAIG